SRAERAVPRADRRDGAVHPRAAVRERGARRAGVAAPDAARPGRTDRAAAAAAELPDGAPAVRDPGRKPDQALVRAGRRAPGGGRPSLAGWRGPGLSTAGRSASSSTWAAWTCGRTSSGWS